MLYIRKYRMLIFFFLSFGVSMANADSGMGFKYDKIASFSSLEVKLIEVSLKEFRETSSDLDKYEVAVYQTTNTYLILFRDSETNKEQYGELPTYEVEISKDTLEVIKAHYSR